MLSIRAIIFPIPIISLFSKAQGGIASADNRAGMLLVYPGAQIRISKYFISFCSPGRASTVYIHLHACPQRHLWPRRWFARWLTLKGSSSSCLFLLPIFLDLQVWKRGREELRILPWSRHRTSDFQTQIGFKAEGSTCLSCRWGYPYIQKDVTPTTMKSHPCSWHFGHTFQITLHLLIVNMITASLRVCEVQSRKSFIIVGSLERQGNWGRGRSSGSEMPWDALPDVLCPLEYTNKNSHKGSMSRYKGWGCKFDF